MKDILVAVDLGAATPQLIKQVIELAKREGATIHLLHVCPGYKKTGNVNREEEQECTAASEKMEQWRTCLQEAIPNCLVKGYLLSGPVQRCILELAHAIKPRLIITGKPGKIRRFVFSDHVNPGALSLQSKCPVLSVVEHDRHNGIKKIILPVRDFIPVRKIELLVVLAKIYRANIFLVALQKSYLKNEKQRHALLESYRILSNGLSNKVECRLLKGADFPLAIAAYARETGSDILIANPGKETGAPGIFNNPATGILTTGSQLKILSVVPYQDL